MVLWSYQIQGKWHQKSALYFTISRSFRQMICCRPSPALWCGTRLPCYFFFFRSLGVARYMDVTPPTPPQLLEKGVTSIRWLRVHKSARSLFLCPSFGFLLIFCFLGHFKNTKLNILFGSFLFWKNKMNWQDGSSRWCLSCQMSIRIRNRNVQRKASKNCWMSVKNKL